MREPAEALSCAAPSADPLDLLTDRQLLIFVAQAHGREMTRLAGLLNISRQTLYRDWRAAVHVLRRVPAVTARNCDGPRDVEDAEPRSERESYQCRRHGQACPETCGFLKLWAARFDRSHPAAR